MSNYWNIGEAAEYFGVGRSVIERIIQNPALGAIRIGQNWRIPKGQEWAIKDAIHGNAPEPEIAAKLTRLYTVAEFADYFSVSHSHIHNLCTSGKIKALKLGERWAIPDSEMTRAKETGIQ